MNSYTEGCIKNCLSLDYSNFEVIVLPDADPENNTPHVKLVATGAVAPPKKRDMAANYASREILAFIATDTSTIIIINKY